MPLEIYSPLKNGSGGALFASFNSKDGAIMFKVIAQTGYDHEKQRGSFKNGKVINLKLNSREVGLFINAFEARGKATFYHSFDNNVAKGSLSHYVRKSDGLDAFGFIIEKDGQTVKIGLDIGEATKLREWLKFALTHVFTAIYAKDKKEYQDRMATQTQESKQNAPEAESEPPAAPQEEADDEPKRLPIVRNTQKQEVKDPFDEDSF